MRDFCAKHGQYYDWYCAYCGSPYKVSYSTTSIPTEETKEDPVEACKRLGYEIDNHEILEAMRKTKTKDSKESVEDVYCQCGINILSDKHLKNCSEHIKVEEEPKEKKCWCGSTDNPHTHSGEYPSTTAGEPKDPIKEQVEQLRRDVNWLYQHWEDRK